MTSQPDTDSSTHTPGEWLFVEGESNKVSAPDDCLGAIVADEWILAEIKSDGPSPEADARLIAAAPTLLKALKAIFPSPIRMMDITDDSCAHIVAQARTAIEEAQS